ncbi:hypothetical protein NDK47_23355 [Brevibacillus ruminantium]|uniref:Secreted protein n=1 Tax=Brevibacillus ruminantium TaxID=2950604 RepID=A0ABY4WDV4_9BACL|nr:hypothetical protein [Brevibacillus ruminantium]USG65026.1 hypothetical protein NDK47_23355 [Brevibacillus ruminantium]
MKKKWLAMAGGIGVGAVLLVTSGLSASANYTGYEAYKDAWKQTKGIDSLGGQLHVTVSDNGKSLIAVDSRFKNNSDQKAASAAVQIDDGTHHHDLNVYHQADKTVFKSGESETYYVMEKQGPAWQAKGKHPEMAAEVENVIDGLVGNLRNNVTLTDDADGGKQVSLHLSGSQIPSAVHALGSLLVKNASLHDHEGMKEQHEKVPFAPAQLDVDFPKLTDQIRVQEINLDATIDAENYLKHQTAVFKIAGKDAAGAEHEVEVKVDVELNGINQTTPDTVDLSGKQVETIQRENGKQHRPW